MIGEIPYRDSHEIEIWSGNGTIFAEIFLID